MGYLEHLRTLEQRLSYELMHLFANLACDYTGEAKSCLRDLQLLVDRHQLGSEWTKLIADLRGNLYESPARAVAVFGLISALQAIDGRPRKVPTD